MPTVQNHLVPPASICGRRMDRLRFNGDRPVPRKRDLHRPRGRRHAVGLRPYERTGRACVMRTFFAPEETEEFEAARSLLIRRTVQWARERGESVDPFGVETALEYRHRGTCDGRLGLWEPRHIEEYLLDWLPRTVTVLPGEEPHGCARHSRSPAALPRCDGPQRPARGLAGRQSC